MAIYLSFSVGVLLWSINREETVTAESVYGAFCGYLLIGVVFGHFYCIVDEIAPHAYVGAATVRPDFENRMERRYLLTYYSFITLTTVGYGDIAPANNFARSLAIIEAIVGQFYMAVLIAELIGKRVAHALSGPRSDSQK
jgi:hypothetical protein